MMHFLLFIRLIVFKAVPENEHLLIFPKHSNHSADSSKFDFSKESAQYATKIYEESELYFHVYRCKCIKLKYANKTNNYRKTESLHKLQEIDYTFLEI